MDRGLFKSILLIIAYFILLILIVLNIDVVLAGIKKILIILIPLFIGIAIAFIMNRPFSFLLKKYENAFRFKNGHKIAKGLAVFTVYLLFFAILAAIITFIIPQLSESLKLLYESLQEFSKQLESYAIKALDYLPVDKFDISNIDTIVDKIPDVSSSLVKGVFPQIFDFTTSVIRSITNLAIGFILSIYLLLDKERLTKQFNVLLKAYIPKKTSLKINRMLKVTNKTFSQFITGQFTEVLILGVLCFIGMIIFRFDYPLLISLIIAITTIIPVIGPIIGIVPAVLILLIADPMQALWFVVFIIVLQQIEGNFIYPKVVGNSVQLSGLMVLLAIIVGGGLFGILGMIIGIPVLSVIYKLLKEDVYDRIESQ